MGIDDLYMGKGLILPVDFFVRKYLNEIKKEYPNLTDNDDPREVLDKIVSKYIGKGYKVCSLGHDALRIRGGHLGISGTSDNVNVVSFIKQWEESQKKSGDEGKKLTAKNREEEDSNEDNEMDDKFTSIITAVSQNVGNLPFTSLFCGELMFLGKFKRIDSDNGFSHYVETAEILYGMAGLLPDIVDYYPKLVATDCSAIEKEIGLKPCIWIFAPDCGCCG